MLCAPLVPVLPAVSPWVTVTVYTPFADNGIVGVMAPAWAMQRAVPFCVVAPVIATDTVAFTPVAVVHAPASVVTVALVVNGNVRATPFTVVSVTVGAVVCTVITFGPEVPVFPAVSDCVAVTE